MKHPNNRMETPENRMPRVVMDQPKEEIEEKPRPKRYIMGIACKYCGAVANHPVRRTYPNKMRVRFCLSCRRDFQTRETDAADM